jgi:hypothetical protein
VCNSVDIKGRRHEITFPVPSMGYSGSLAIHEPDVEISLATPSHCARRGAAARFAFDHARDHLLAIESILVVMEIRLGVPSGRWRNVSAQFAAPAAQALHIPEVCLDAWV